VIRIMKKTFTERIEWARENEFPSLNVVRSK
jgi:hypothetical protein